MRDFAGRYGFALIASCGCEVGTANAAMTVQVRYGSNNLEFDQFRVASAHFAQQPSGTTDRQDCVTSLPWPAPFSLKLNPAHVVRGMVAAFDPSKHMVRLRCHGLQ